eukprot:jgi/Chrzof1/11382/Cz05g34220.t1
MQRMTTCLAALQVSCSVPGLILSPVKPPGVPDATSEDGSSHNLNPATSLPGPTRCDSPSTSLQFKREARTAALNDSHMDILSASAMSDIQLRASLASAVNQSQTL